MIALFALNPSQAAASSFHASGVTPIGKRALVSAAAITAASNRYAISRHETGAWDAGVRPAPIRARRMRQVLWIPVWTLLLLEPEERSTRKAMTAVYPDLIASINVLYLLEQRQDIDYYEDLKLLCQHDTIEQHRGQSDHI